MPDLSPFIVAILAALAVALAVRAYVGHTDRRIPLCRRCGRDAREFAWRENYRCDCAAALETVGTVYFPRKRSKRAIALAALFVLATPLFAWWAIEVRARGVGWRDELPTWAYASLLAGGWDLPWHLSATRRLGDDCTTQDAALIRDAALARWEREKRLSGSTWSTVVSAAALAPPEGAVGERFARAEARHFEFVASQRASDIAINAHHIGPRYSTEGPCLGRVTSVKVGDRGVPFVISRLEPRGPSGTVQPVEHREWFAFDGDNVIVVPNETLTNETIRLVGLIAIADAPSDAVEFDDVIAQSADPARWGIRAALAPIEVDAVTVVTPAADDGTPITRGWIDERTKALWGHDEVIEIMPSLAAVPLVVMAILATLVAFVLAAAIPLARGLSRGRPRLAPPACRACAALLRAEGESLPPRCQECGVAIAGRDDCCFVVRTSRLRRAACWLVVGAAVGALLCGTPALYRALFTGVNRTLASPEAQAAWLVDATVAHRPHAMGPTPPNRLMYFAPKDRSELEAAVAELRLWWSQSKGALPYSAADREGEYRRRAIGTFIANAFQRDAISVDDVRPIAQWCSKSDPLWPALTLPPVVRAGESIKAAGRVHQATDVKIRLVDYASERPVSDWSNPHELELGAMPEPGTARLQVEWSRDLLADINGRSTVAWPITNSSGAFFPSLGLLEREVVAVAADAPPALTGSLIERLAESITVELQLQETGERDVLIVRTNAPWSRLSMRGRWEVRLDSSSDTPALAVLRLAPTGSPPTALAALPDPWPATIFVRFVPELPESSFTSQAKFPGGFFWGQATTFPLRRRDDMRRDGNVIARFR